jgi:hypothetical protein
MATLNVFGWMALDLFRRQRHFHSEMRTVGEVRLHLDHMAECFGRAPNDR